MRDRSGFTLVELLVAVSLAAVLFIAINSFFWQSVRSWKFSAAKYLQRQAVQICLERIKRDIRSASRVLPSSSTAEVFFLSGGEVYSYRLFEQKLRRKKGSSSAYLSSEGEIEDLSFSYPSAREVIIHSGRWFINVSARN